MCGCVRARVCVYEFNYVNMRRVWVGGGLFVKENNVYNTDKRFKIKCRNEIIAEFLCFHNQ